MDGLLCDIAHRCSADLKKEYAGKFKETYTSGTQKPIILLDDVKGSLNYEESTELYRGSRHIGQRKLFLNEVDFCVEVGKKDTSPVIFYAGAAPNQKGAFLASLFPGFKFVFIDPERFNIQKPLKYKINIKMLRGKNLPSSTDLDIITSIKEDIVKEKSGSQPTQIYIINDIMTLSLAKAIAKNFPVNYFISDIRTNSSDKEPDAVDILWNLAQQYNWINEMKSCITMLKFRHPFYSASPEEFFRLAAVSPRVEDFALAKANGIDFVDNFSRRQLVYFKGEVRMQPWSGQTSTESRLVSFSPAGSLHDWGTPEAYENTYFYYNSISRWLGIFDNDNADKDIGFDKCNDCALENVIWKKYVHSTPHIQQPLTVRGLVRELSAITNRPLCAEGHGSHFGCWLLRELKSRVESHINAKKRKY